ncbi:MAG: phenylalanine--tRNA ligase subunit beta [Magnetococcales bacterium]|nr:phenylalanine--tRNA ligase subunit beta [Magnetococcales bacterium]
MKFTDSWLRDHLTTRLTPTEIGDRLTMSGLELESMDDLAAGLEKVRSGVLESVDKHPDADRLTVCSVRVDAEVEPLTIVCGATNHKAGDTVAVATVGAQLPNGMKIKKGKIRGQVSEGMLCSTKELGMTETADGILILPQETPVGAPITEILSRNDWLFEVDMTPNRGDCLGVRGIARDLAAVTGEALRPLESDVTVDPTVADRHPVSVVIEDRAGCPRYAGRVIESVRIGPSPDWLVRRLEDIGLRSINNIVDITNYILMDLNQPLHAFDLEKLAPPIVVRRANRGETLTTLDEVERTLTDSMTLIADQTRSLALAGIMGGEESGVIESTTTIFLESAYFEPVRTARTGRALSIISDSRYRFERGTDPEGIITALDRATRLILELAGGTAGPVILEDAGTWSQPAPVPFRTQRANEKNGISLSDEKSHSMLERLGCERTEVSSDAPGLEGAVWFQPPSHRHDLKREEDLIEEIVRLYGYDAVPSVLPTGAISVPEVDRVAILEQKTQTILAGLGYFEAVNYAFIDATAQSIYDPDRIPVALQNPISEDLAVMRTTLVAGLLQALQRNVSRGNGSVRLFEVGSVFHADTAMNIIEPGRIAALCYGPIDARAWHTSQRIADFFDLKGDLEHLLDGLGIRQARITAEGPDFLHPGRKATLSLRNTPESVGWIGELHPEHQEALGLTHPALLMELSVPALLAAPRKRTNDDLVSKFPAVERDFAFIVDETHPVQDVLDAIRKAADSKLIRDVRLFDVYTGEHVPEGKKSLALGITLQASDRTLTDAESQSQSDRIVATMEKRFDAILRG